MAENESKAHRMVELGELRVKLDQMTERIVSRFKDRSRFPLNEVVYQPDGVAIVGRSGISFLQFALEGLEAYHASLGRYDYEDQYQVLDSTVPPIEKRIVDRVYLPKLSINISDDLIAFYKGILKKNCKPEDEPDTYGETVYIDADLLQMINERVNIGRYVAEVKRRKDPSIYQSTDDHDLLMSKLKDREREEELISRVREIARTYELAPDMAEQAFRWMIEETLLIEIIYIQNANRTDKEKDTAL